MAEIELNQLFPKAQSKPIAIREAWNNLFIQSDAPKFSERYKKYWELARPGDSVGKLNSVRKLHLFHTSPTLTKNEGYGGVYHPFECRPISTAERKRLASFPDKFIFLNWENCTQCIGNSVPPLFMHAIATQIRYVLWNGKPVENSKMTTDYPTHLELMWQKHLAPREVNAPTVISTFAGGGGSSLGYSMAGYRELLAVEWDNNAVETFQLNFPDIPVYHGDIAKLSVEECLRLARIKPGELDILDGSPPCQGFSTAGKRILDDPRNSLFKEYIRLLRGLRPKVFVMENVSGMVKGKMKLIFAEIMRELKASGYRVSARLMNAMYFHVPQSRERMIFIGVRNDLDIEPSHPKAESKSITVREALIGIEKLSGSLPVYGTKLFECCNRMIQGTTASDFYKKSWGFNLFRLAWNSPSPTFTKGGGCCGLIHPDLPRKCIKEEYAAIMSYPRLFKFGCTDETARAILSNSVPPLFMEAIARHIRQSILERLQTHTGQQPVRVT